jgi:hypothetical protein
MWEEGKRSENITVLICFFLSFLEINLALLLIWSLKVPRKCTVIRLGSADFVRNIFLF